ncbi:MAG: hypothetical protein H0V01_04725 [Bacteroidetes bacterium]|nr:hypothetical protein [Bacteroidota bacterium]HET6242984.1 hypothetical protein [Bacteroidia bacterium]
MKKINLLLLFLIILSSCNRIDEFLNKDSERILTSLEEPTSVIDEYFHEIKNNNFHKIHFLYSDLFFQNITTEELINHLKKFLSLTGELKSFKLIEANIENTNGQKVIVLLYHVDYSEHSSVEKFSLLKEKSSYKIFGHNIKSDVF